LNYVEKAELIDSQDTSDSDGPMENGQDGSDIQKGDEK
jgi:hypothetical protein